MDFVQGGRREHQQDPAENEGPLPVEPQQRPVAEESAHQRGKRHPGGRAGGEHQVPASLQGQHVAHGRQGEKQENYQHGQDLLPDPGRNPLCHDKGGGVSQHESGPDDKQDHFHGLRDGSLRRDAAEALRVI